ncbi:AAA family ATPase [Sorangium sp. So ce134]
MGVASHCDRVEALPETSRFQIVRQLGAGGMGVVFEAIDLLRGTRVALKVLRRLSPEALLRFKTEFRALQDLQHPNLIRLDELIADGQQWCFTMECVAGVDFLAHVGAPVGESAPALSHTLEETAETGSAPWPAGPGAGAPPAPEGAPAPGRCFDEARLRGALKQLVQGLAALHAAGKVHRDIKPSNILVTPEGRVVLLDFGVIADVRRAPDGYVVGTPLYMAPEQTDARAVGPAADWYAVGLVLYQALTGRMPFGAAPLEALELRKRLEPAPPSSLGADVPEDLDRLCADLLRIDPGARPDDAEVLRRLSIRTVDPGTHGCFVGRVRELGELDACFAAVRSGGSRALLVHGESGAGKTALVSRFLEQIERAAPAVVVLAGRCCERESVPYKAVDEIVDDLIWHLNRLPPAEAAALLPEHAAALAQLFPVLQHVPLVAAAVRAKGEPALGPRELRLRAFATLRELLAGLARRQPLVLSIDDLQWADADSLALLADVMAPPAPPGLLLLATVRSPGGATGGAAELLPEARHLRLAGLPPDEARELAGALLARELAQPDERQRIAAVIAGESGGHPLFIDELVRRKLALGMQAETPRLEEALAARVRDLEAEDRAVLELVATAGAPLAREIVAATAGLGFDELARRIASLRAVNLLRRAATPAGPAVEPYHDRVRRVVLSGLALEAQRGLHLRLAETLEQRGADAETLAVHFHEAGEARRAAPWATVAAARAAAALAFDRAASLFRMAAAHEPTGTPEGRRLRIGLAEALVNAGRCAEAARAFEEAAVGADGPLAAELQRRAAEQYLRSGHIDAGLAATAGALEPLGIVLPRTPRGALASLVVRQAHLRLRGLRYRERAASEIPAEELSRIDICCSLALAMGIADHVRGADVQARHVLLALEAGEPVRLARALAMEAGYVSAGGMPSRARAAHLLDLAVGLARRIDDPHVLGHVDAFGAVLAFGIGDWRSARAHCERARATLRDRCLGVTWELDSIEFIELWALYYEGELAELSRRVLLRLRDAEERGDRFTATNLRTSFVPLVRLAADQPAEARREGARAAREWSSGGFHLQHYNFEIFSEGQIGLYLGEAEAAYHRISKRWTALRVSMLTLFQQLRIEALHVRARCALGAASAARGLARERWLWAAARDARRIGRARARWSEGLAHLLAAGIAAVRGDRETAAQLACEAARGCEAAHMGLYAAAARRCLGALVQGDRGRRLVAEADAWMASQGVLNPPRMTAVLAPGFPGA